MNNEHHNDTVDNVIALCPNHHREAHFGTVADSLRDEMLRVVEKQNNLLKESG
jgi:predicted restriction endonuclease